MEVCGFFGIAGEKRTWRYFGEFCHTVAVQLEQNACAFLKLFST